MDEEPNLENLARILHDSADIDTSRNGIHFRRPEKSLELRALIYRRRHTRNPQDRSYLSKQFLKLARKETRKWRTQWSDHLLDQFRNLKSIQKISLDPIKSHTSDIEPEDFAEFLEKLFQPEHPQDLKIDYRFIGLIPKFSYSELKLALSQLSNLRSADDSGLTAEMIKYSSRSLQ